MAARPYGGDRSSARHHLHPAVRINDRSQIVGSTASFAFLWQHGRTIALPRLKGASGANDINDRGQIVGYSTVKPDGTNTYAAACRDGWRNRRYLEQMLTVHLDHYNTAPPLKGAINRGVPAAESEPAPASLAEIRRIDRGDVVGGLVHEYRHAA